MTRLLLAQAAWIVFAALQGVAAVATRARVPIALTFALAGVLMVAGAAVNEIAPLIVGSAAALLAPLWVSADRGRLNPSHHLARGGLLAFLLVLTSWANS